MLVLFYLLFSEYIGSYMLRLESGLWERELRSWAYVGR